MTEQEKLTNSEDSLKDSSKTLHAAKPSENISILDTSTQSSEELIEKLHETHSFEVHSVSEAKSEESNQVKYNSQEKMEQLNTSRYHINFEKNSWVCIRH